MSPKVAVYARVSKAEAERRETSVPVQIADCRERAAAEGWTVLEEETDEGISAWDRRKVRPGFKRLVVHIQSGLIDTILIREQERLLRDMEDAIILQREADAGRLKLIASTMESDINFGRARDEKDFRDRASQAAFYSKFLSQKVKRTKAARKRDGKFTGGVAFGYRSTPDGLVIEPVEAAHIHGAVQRLSDGVSQYRICMDWNDAGVRTPWSKRWRPVNLRRMLTGEHLVGGNGYPPILTEVEAAIVRQRLDNQPTLGRGRPKGRRNALAGLVVCAVCGAKLSGGAGRYRCLPGHTGCGKVSIEATALERFLVQEMFRLRFAKLPRRARPDTVEWVFQELKTYPGAAEVSDKYLRQMAEQYAGKYAGHLQIIDRLQAAAGEFASKKGSAIVQTSDKSRLLQEVKTIERRIEELSDQVADGKTTVAFAGRTAKKLEARRRKLTDQLARSLPPAPAAPQLWVGDVFTTIEFLQAASEATIGELVATGVKVATLPQVGTDFRERWQARQLTEAEVAALRDLLTAEVGHATIAPRERRGKKFEPTRVNIVWR